MSDRETRERRWRLALGGEDGELGDEDRRLSAALTMLYGGEEDGEDDGKKRHVGREYSQPKVSKWMDDIREFFPSPVVQVVQKDAFDRLGLERMLMEPEFLEAMEANVDLVATLISLRNVLPNKVKDSARAVIEKVVEELVERLERKTSDAVRGAVDRSKRTSRPRFADIDWARTIQKNLHTYQADQQTVIPERLVGFQRKQRRIVDLDEVILCVDQSGSMGRSVVYASIFSAVMASLPVVKTKLICYDTEVVDWTEDLADPVDVQFGVQLGGGNDTNKALQYIEDRLERPTKAHLVLISDLYEGAGAPEMISRLAKLKALGVNVIVLLALSDEGQPSFDAHVAEAIASYGAPVFACTPDQFPDLMAAALRRDNLLNWAAGADIKLVSAAETGLD
ncbi:MAG: VWA domain-containing protein [Pseudomonadota bacterium]